MKNAKSILKNCMNTILQKRIEEAVETLINYNLVDLGDLVNQYDLRRMLIEIGVKTLQNQWISVDEALPKANELVFGCVNDEGIPQSVGTAYYDEYGSWHYSDEEETVLITHWMEIPSLEGGEE